MLIATLTVVVASAAGSAVEGARADLCTLAAALAKTPPDDVARRAEAIAALHAAASSPSSTDAADGGCFAAFEVALRDAIVDHHRAAQKSKKHDEYVVARAGYDAYFALPGMKATENAERFTFFRAELLWDLGEWRAAAAGYQEIVERWPMGEYAITCAYNDVLAWEKVVNKEPAPRVNARGRLGWDDDDWPVVGRQSCQLSRQSPDLSADERSMIAALVRYERLRALRPSNDAKHVDELLVVMFKHAYILHSHELRRAEATPIFQEIVRRAPDSEYARKASDLMIQPR